MADRKRLESKPSHKGPKVESDSESEDEESETEAAAAEATESPEEAPASAAAPVGGQLSIDLSEDGLLATLRTLFPATTIKEVLSLLEQQGVTHGIAEPAIKKALQTVSESGEPVRDIVVAQGSPPKPPPPGRIEHQPIGELTELPPLKPIAKALGEEEPDALKDAFADLTLCLVRPGDHLATLLVDPGQPGKGVMGQEIPYKATEADSPNPLLKPAAGAKLSGTGTEYQAEIYGFAGLHDGRVAVLPPVWISPNGLTAAVICPRVLADSGAPEPEELTSTLNAAEVTIGINEKRVAALCAALAKGPVKGFSIPVAQGISPVPAEDGTAEFSFPYRSRVGALQPDGSIDFKDRNLFPPVTKDALLVERVPPKDGTEGKTVRGEPITIPKPGDVELEPGEGVRVEGEGSEQKLFADTDGGASVQTTDLTVDAIAIKRYAVSVRPVAQISGDVSYETGNLDFRGNVEIKGSIASGFKVKATGDISIAGSVEAGAVLECGGSISVGQGIVGEDTRIDAGGDLSAKFIQEARVTTGGEILVGSYIHNARVQSRSTIQVEGRGGSGGGIVGGETWALKGIRSQNAGSVRSTTTFLGVGIDPELHEQFEKSVQSAREADILLKNLLKALALPSLDANAVKDLIRKNPAKKNVVVHYVKKANQLAQVEQGHIKEQEDIAARILQATIGVTLDIPDVAFARIKVRIGTEEVQTKNDVSGVRFSFNKQDGIVQEALTDKPAA